MEFTELAPEREAHTREGGDGDGDQGGPREGRRRERMSSGPCQWLVPDGIRAGAGAGGGDDIPAYGFMLSRHTPHVVSLVTERSKLDGFAITL